MGLFSKHDRFDNDDGAILPDSVFIAMNDDVLSTEDVEPAKSVSEIDSIPMAHIREEQKNEAAKLAAEAAINNIEHNDSALKPEQLSKKSSIEPEKQIKMMEQPDKPETPSLVARCLPFMIDDEGNNVSENQPPVYTLDSVDDIINSFEKKAEEKITGLYTAKSDASETPKATTISAKPIVNEIKTFQSSVEDTKIIRGKVIGKNPLGAAEATRQFTAIDPERIAKPENLGDTKTIDTPVINDVPSGDKKFSPLSREQSDIYDDIIDDMNGYKSPADAHRFYNQYRAVRSFALISAIVSAVFAIALFLLETPLFSTFRTNSTAAYNIINISVVCISLLVNFRVFKGFSCFAGGNMRSDISFAVSGIISIIYSIVYLCLGKLGEFGLGALSAFGLFVCALAEFFRADYTVNNFRRIATAKRKSAYSLIKGNDANTISASAIDGDSLIGAGQRCVNILGFVRSSESYDAGAKIINITTAVSVGVAAIVGIISSIISKDASSAFGITALIICLGCSPAATLMSILPLKRISDYLKRYNAQIPGYINAERIERANALALDSRMLFPEGTVELVNMKVLGESSIDNILVESAALTSAIGSPLAPIFLDIAGTRGKNAALPEADSLKYEEKMGISGWIGEHHLFIGNRTLLEARGIKAAPIEVDRKILKSGAFPVYIACNGRPEALLIVKYTASSKVRYELARACSTGITLLINNCDPNIGTAMLCDYFGIYEDLVKIMPPKSVEVYKTATTFEENVFANASFMGDACGMLAITTAAIKLKSFFPIITALTLITQLGAVAATAVLALTNALTIGTIGICLYHLVATIVIYCAARVYKP